MGHGFSRQITEKYGTKYGNGNYILGHPKWKWELYFGTEGVVFLTWRTKTRREKVGVGPRFREKV